MKTRYILIIFSLIFNTLIYSQDNDSVKHMQDSILKSYDKKFLKSKSNKTDALFISFKGGYHHDIPVNDYGLKGSWVIDASIGALMNKHFILGVNFDFWKTSVNNYSLDGSNNMINRDYKGEGFNFFLKYRISLFRKTYNLEPGGGIGAYRISSIDEKGNFEGHGYLNLNARLGFNMKILDFQIGTKNLDLHIDSEISYYSLVTLAKQKNLYRMINFKLGPTIYMYY